MSMSSAKAEASAPRINQPTDLREWLEANGDVLTVVEKPVAIDDIGALTAQSQGPIIFDNIKEHPGYRMCDMLVTRRCDQARCLGVDEGDYLKTLARALR
ncbi:MAG: hypothetical protein QF450_11015, partial [Rhodospirillales bacterium]|nr:hypothetical protein [Rhodospirillales bacterium]